MSKNTKKISNWLILNENQSIDQSKYITNSIIPMSHLTHKTEETNNINEKSLSKLNSLSNPSTEMLFDIKTYNLSRNENKFKLNHNQHHHHYHENKNDLAATNERKAKKKFPILNENRNIIGLKQKELDYVIDECEQNGSVFVKKRKLKETDIINESKFLHKSFKPIKRILIDKRLKKIANNDVEESELTKSPISGTYIIKEWDSSAKRNINKSNNKQNSISKSSSNQTAISFTKEEVELNSIAASFVQITPQIRAKLEKIPNKIGPYECKLCKIVYKDAFELAMHNCPRVVHIEYKCSECEKIFNCPANLASHKRWHRPRPDAANDDQPKKDPTNQDSEKLVNNQSLKKQLTNKEPTSQTELNSERRRASNNDSSCDYNNFVAEHKSNEDISLDNVSPNQISTAESASTDDNMMMINNKSYSSPSYGFHKNQPNESIFNKNNFNMQTNNTKTESDFPLNNTNMSNFSSTNQSQNPIWNQMIYNQYTESISNYANPNILKASLLNSMSANISSSSASSSQSSMPMANDWFSQLCSNYFAAATQSLFSGLSAGIPFHLQKNILQNTKSSLCPTTGTAAAAAVASATATTNHQLLNNTISLNRITPNSFQNDLNNSFLSSNSFINSNQQNTIVSTTNDLNSFNEFI